MGSINSLSNNYLQSILNDLRQTASTNSTSANSTSTLTASSVGQSSSSDNSQLSPLGQVLSTLQQLQQSNPTEYQQLTGQIATNLQAAAQTATNDRRQAARLSMLTRLSHPVPRGALTPSTASRFVFAAR